MMPHFLSMFLDHHASRSMTTGAPMTTGAEEGEEKGSEQEGEEEGSEEEDEEDGGEEEGSEVEGEESEDDGFAFAIPIGD